MEIYEFKVNKIVLYPEIKEVLRKMEFQRIKLKIFIGGMIIINMRRQKKIPI
jgi:hypothetical protein